MFEDIYISLLNQEPLSHEGGHELRFICPQCGNPKGRFYVNAETGQFICFHEEDFHGGIYTFMHQIYQMSIQEIKEYLADWDIESDETLQRMEEGSSLYDELITLQANQGLANTTPTKTMPVLPTNYQPLIKNMNNPQAFPYANYLYQRGVTYDQLVKHEIGYVIKGEVPKSDGSMLNVFQHVIFITKNNSGQPIYWNSRSIMPKTKVKSFNGVALENQYSRKDVIFNLNNLQPNDSIVVCEGVFNALTIDNPTDHYLGVATFGKFVTDTQIEQLVQVKDKVKHFYLFLDSDAVTVMIELAERMNKAGIDNNQIYLVFNPYRGKDINDLGYSLASQLIQKASFPHTFAGQLKFKQLAKTY